MENLAGFDHDTAEQITGILNACKRNATSHDRKHQKNSVAGGILPAFISGW